MLIYKIQEIVLKDINLLGLSYQRQKYTEFSCKHDVLQIAFFLYLLTI